jgi:2-polyprenyl-3-methyl-5-hydroxy-6-metoxy-1,4-benzoquinol methylase
VTAAYLPDQYSSKPETYYRGARADYVGELPTNGFAAILEIGCGNGATGALAIAAEKCGTYVGVEMFAPMADEAANVLTAVHTGNIETMVLPYGPETFDVLICSEVLEHLVDPGAALRRVVPLLKPGAQVFASSPNISYLPIVLGLLAGRFTYREEGVMDQTHLRWFTPQSFVAMFADTGLNVEQVQPLNWTSPLTRTIAKLPLGHLIWKQIDVRARKPT